jgi:ribosomal protein L31
MKNNIHANYYISITFLDSKLRTNDSISLKNVENA